MIRVKSKKGPAIFILAVFIITFLDFIPKKIHHKIRCAYQSGTEIYEDPKIRGFIEREPSGFARVHIPTSHGSEVCDLVCQKSLTDLFLHHDARESIIDLNLFINVVWNGRAGYPGYPDKYAKLWVTDNTNPYCLAVLKEEDFENYCGKECVRKNKCIAGKPLTGFITPYILEDTGWWDLKDKEFGVVRTYSALKNNNSESYAAYTTTFTYIGGFLSNILPILFQGHYKNSKNSCENMPWTHTKKEVIHSFFSAK